MGAEWIPEPALLVDEGWVDPRAIWVLRPGTSLPHRQYNSNSRVSSRTHLLQREGMETSAQTPVWYRFNPGSTER